MFSSMSGSCNLHGLVVIAEIRQALLSHDGEARVSCPRRASSSMRARVAWRTFALYPPHNPRLEVTTNRSTRAPLPRGALSGFAARASCACEVPRAAPRASGSEPRQVRAKRLRVGEARIQLHDLRLRHLLHGPRDLVDVADARGCAFGSPVSLRCMLLQKRLLERAHGRVQHLGLGKRAEVPDARKDFRFLGSSSQERNFCSNSLHPAHGHIVQESAGCRVQDHDLLLHRQGRVLLLLERLHQSGAPGQLRLRGLVQLGSHLGERLQLPVGGKVDAQGARPPASSP